MRPPKTKRKVKHRNPTKRKSKIFTKDRIKQELMGVIVDNRCG